MVKLEGTIRKIICNKPSDSSPWMIAQIQQPNGEKVVIKGKLTTNVECSDYAVGNFDLQETSYGQEYQTKSVVHISPPHDKAAIMERVTNFAHSLGLRMTVPVKMAIEELMKSGKNFWVALDNAEGPACILPIKAKAADYNERYNTGFVESTEIEGYFHNLGLNWSDKKIRKALGYEEDCEHPDREPIPIEKLKTDPMIIIGLPGIHIRDVMDYLSALISLGLIDEPTMRVGILLKDLLESEHKQNTCMFTPEDIEPLRTHPVFKKYCAEYKNCIYRSTTFEKEQSVSIFISARVQSQPSESLYAEDIEERIKQLAPDQGKIPTADQCAAIAKVFREPVLLILGGAGTGKTTALRLLCRYILRYLPTYRSNVLFLAPTGKAVQRIKDSIANLYFSEMDNAMTIHRFASACKNIQEHECGKTCQPVCKLDAIGWAENTPHIIVVDESIMVDNDTMYLLVSSLYKLIQREEFMPHIVFIGDDAQLQPVGCGNPIIDIIKSGVVPIHRLEKIHRQIGESVLLDAVTAIRERRKFTSTDETFQIIPIDEKNLKTIVLKWIDTHPGDQNAIIVPTNTLVTTITPIVREHLNPVSKNPLIMLGPREYKFRKGDKVMQIKNNYGRGVFNGTCGHVVDVIDSINTITQADGKKVEVPIKILHVRFHGRENDYYYTLDEGYDELAFAYVFTTHKAQGSEYEHVLILMNKPIPGFINRNLIYTAASRGKTSVTIGLENTGIRSQWREMPAERNTNLIGLIDEKVEYEA